jgi:hypothetical protein
MLIEAHPSLFAGDAVLAYQAELLRLLRSSGYACEFLLNGQERAPELAPDRRWPDRTHIFARLER